MLCILYIIIIYNLLFFIKVPDVVVPIIDTIPSTQTNSAKEDGEIAQENHSSSEMFQDLENQRTIFKPDVSRSRTGLISGLISAKKAFYIPRNNLEKKREVFCPVSTTDGPNYTTTKLKTVYIASFVKMPIIIAC